MCNIDVLDFVLTKFLNASFSFGQFSGTPEFLKHTQKMASAALKMFRFFEKNCHVLKISRSLRFLKKYCLSFQSKGEIFRFFLLEFFESVKRSLVLRSLDTQAGMLAVHFAVVANITDITKNTSNGFVHMA